MKWWIQKGSETREMSDDKLRRRLKQNDLSGMELARLDDSDEWMPLYSYPVFREIVGHSQTGAYRAAAGRQVQGFVWHLVMWSAFLVFFLQVAGTWIPSFFWGIGLFVHLTRTVPALRLLRRRSQDEAEKRSETNERQAKRARRVAAVNDEFLRDLEDVLAALEQRTPDIDIAEVRAGAERLHERRLDLQQLTSETGRAALEAEVETVAAQVAAAPDDRTREAHESHLGALRERIASMTEALNASYRLEARERALLHQLEGLRLALHRATVENVEPPDLSVYLERVHGELRAVAEVEEHVAKAKRAQQKKVTNG